VTTKQRKCALCKAGEHAFHRRVKVGDTVDHEFDEVVVVTGRGVQQRGLYIWLGRKDRCVGVLRGPAIAIALVEGINEAFIVAEKKARERRK
jgi:hypothetical protein